MTRLPLDPQCVLQLGPLSPFLTPVTAPLFSPDWGFSAKRLPGFMVLGVCALRTEWDRSWTTSQLMKEMLKAQRGAVSSPRSHSKAQKHLISHLPISCSQES